MGYNIYSFFLIAAIAGIPSAIAKQVAHYNALNEYGVGVRLYKRGLVLAVATGVICASILYFGAPLIDGGNPAVIPVLHSLAWAILIIPTMSLTRGYFQGYQQMAPSAISQFVEQLARVAYMLLTAFIIMRLLHGSWVHAVAQSTFAAFIGAWPDWQRWAFTTSDVVRTFATWYAIATIKFMLKQSNYIRKLLPRRSVIFGCRDYILC